MELFRRALFVVAGTLVACQAVIGLDKFKKDPEECDFTDCSTVVPDAGTDAGMDAPDYFGDASAAHRWVAWPMPNPPDADTDANIVAYSNPFEAGVDGGTVMVIRDQVTKLEWMAGAGPSLSFPDAQKYCDGLGNNFRLPTRIELVSLWDYTRKQPAFAPNFNGAPGSYWTQSPGLPDKTTAWIVDFGGAGTITKQSLGTQALVRCVR